MPNIEFPVLPAEIVQELKEIVLNNLPENMIDYEYLWSTNPYKELTGFVSPINDDTYRVTFYQVWTDTTPLEIIMSDNYEYMSDEELENYLRTVIYYELWFTVDNDNVNINIRKQETEDTDDSSYILQQSMGEYSDIATISIPIEQIKEHLNSIDRSILDRESLELYNWLVYKIAQIKENRTSDNSNNLNLTK